MGDDSEWLKLPTDEKVQHKAWKARISGYEECVNLFKRIDDEKNPEFSKYLGLVKKMATDTNAIAQEKALDAVLLFVEKAHAAGRTAGEVCSGVVAKCLNASRTKTKEKGQEILLMYIEIEKQEVVVEELLKGLTNKQPKIVAACVQTLRMSICEFGHKTIGIKPIVKQLQKLLEDRNGDVRKKANEAILPFMIHIGYEKMVRHAGKLKATSKEPVLKILEANKVNLPAPVKSAKAKVVKPAKSAAVRDISPDEPIESEPVAAPAAKVVKGKAKPGQKKPAATSKSKKEEEDLSPPMKKSNGKEQRIKDEKNLKALKWNFTTPRGEFVEQLRTQMEMTFSAGLVEKLYHNDFKQHIKGVEIFQKCISELPEETIANLDLILKWITLRFFDTNTSVLLKALEYLQILFSMLAEHEYHLKDFEAIAFISYLVNKVGDPKDNIRKDIRNIFKLLCKIYPASKMFTYIMDGIKSKISKQRMECLEELGCLIESFGINVCQPSPAQALKVLAQQIGDRDNSVRSAALNTIVTAYHILGESVYKYVGNLSEKDMSMLEERIKRSSKNKPPPPSVQQPTKTPQEGKPKLVKPVPSKNVMEQRSQVSSKRQGHFRLELDDDNEDEIELPNLIQHDLDDMDTPIKLPKTRMRPPSPSIKLLSGSNDAKSAIDIVISQVASNDILTSIQALTQIDELVKDSDKSELLAGHVDQFLVVCSLQMRMAYSSYMGDVEVDRTVVIRLYKCLMGSLLAVIQSGTLGKSASRDVLRDFLQILLTIMLDSRLQELDDGPQVIRSVNVMVVKIIDKADVTQIMSALIKLMHESVANEMGVQKFLDLVMKGLWKMVRMLPNIINDLNIDKIVGDLHQFLKEFPGNTWKSKASDTPLRTVKTILHSMAKLQGNKIIRNLSQIDSQDSEVVAYLQKVLRNDSDSNTVYANNKNEQLNGAQDGEVEMRTPSANSASKSKRMSKLINDMLAEIFKKIGSKENTQEGIQDLHDFKQKYPEADLEPFLKKSSQFFQNYIERGLKNIEKNKELKELKQKSSSALMTSNSTGTLSSSSVTNTNDDDSDSNASEYWERLKSLRARYRLNNEDNSEGDAGDPTEGPDAENFEKFAQNIVNSSPSLSSSSSNDHVQDSSAVDGQASAPSPAVSAANILDLKKRLARIKQSKQ